jgi:uncharacterized membrane protein YdjX (TVP38/TMEM64 family)
MAKLTLSKPVIFALALVVLVVAVLTLPVVDWLQGFFTWIEANPTIAWAVFALFYIVAVVLMLPGSLLTLGAGYLFGLGAGFAIVSFASTVGATCAFRAWTFCGQRLGGGQTRRHAQVFSLGSRGRPAGRLGRCC